MIALLNFMIYSTLTFFSYSHGMSDLGPHQGHIQMPGPFHTELVADQDGKTLRVYLLDIEIKNPTLKNSTIQVTLKNKNTLAIVCTPQMEYFKCTSSVKFKNSDEIIIKATREGVVGNDAIYKWPLTVR